MRAVYDTKQLGYLYRIVSSDVKQFTNIPLKMQRILFKFPGRFSKKDEEKEFFTTLMLKQVVISTATGVLYLKHPEQLFADKHLLNVGSTFQIFHASGISA